MIKHQTRSKISEELHSVFPLRNTLDLCFEDVSIRLKTNCYQLVSSLRNYFRDFVSEATVPDIFITAFDSEPVQFSYEFTLKQPDPGKTKVKEEWVDLEDGRIVRKRLTGMSFIFGFGENLVVGPCVENSNQVINFINNRYIEFRLLKGALLGHASGVLWNERGMSFAGFSGAGKSTLVLQLLNQNATFISNDRLMIEDHNDELMMHGVAKLPRINPGTALNNKFLEAVIPEHEKSRFLKLSKDELWNLEHKYDVFIDECYGPGRFRLTSPMDALVILNWKRNGNQTLFNKIDVGTRPDLLPAFMKSTGLFYLPLEKDTVDRSMEGYINLLSKCDVFEVTGGVDFDFASETCFRYLETGSIEQYA